MDTFSSLVMGFQVVLTPENLWLVFLGSIWGTLVGVLPGVGPAAGTALLLPLTFKLPPTGAIIMLAAIFYGSQYGGTITTILLKVPGEASSAVTMLDGHAMANKGRGGVALGMAAIGSFIGGTAATIGLVLAAPALASVALRFGPPEYFALITVGLSLAMGLAGRSLVKAVMAGLVGMLASMVGMDSVEGMPRYSFGINELLDGVELISFIMGMFGVSEILLSVEQPVAEIVKTTLRSVIPTQRDVRDSIWPVFRGTVIGFFVGLLPGMTLVVSSFTSYIVERRMSKHPEKFGTGVIEGVVGPETANNAHSNAALIPMFSLGIPTGPVVAMLMAAFIINGLAPGPQLFKERPDVVWGIIASLYIGNVMLLVLNLPLIPLWVQVLKIPRHLLFSLILGFMIVGSFSANNSMFDVWVTLTFGVLGYLMKKLDFPIVPTVLTFVLGPMMEKALYQSLVMSHGEISILFTRPISLAFLVVAAIILASFGLARALPRGLDVMRGESDV